MNVITRPSAVGVSRRGYPKLDPAECAAYRKARGVTQMQLAYAMRVAQPYISVNEKVNRVHRGNDYELTERTWGPFLDMIDTIAERHQDLVAEGLAELAAIRAARDADRIASRGA